MKKKLNCKKKAQKKSSNINQKLNFLKEKLTNCKKIQIKY